MTTQTAEPQTTEAEDSCPIGPTPDTPRCPWYHCGHHHHHGAFTSCPRATP